MSVDQVSERWSNFIELLSEDLESDEVEAWVNKLSLVEFKPGAVILGGINQFFCNWIRDNHYDLIRGKILKSFHPLGLDLEFQLQIQVKKKVPPRPKPAQIEKALSLGNLNPQFHFDNFVNGGNSDIAFAAAQAVGENIYENKYNPLFICGDVGLGKTHLIQAVGIKAKLIHNDLRIQYTNSERFTNEVIEGIRFRSIQKVRNKYRDIDLLLLDDIQFLENKESTQEEFFHIFNELIQNKKQIILTADRYPREIKNLEERLVNRFNSGMVARIGRPNFETRVAITRNKVAQMGIPLSDEHVNLISSSVRTNVRDILGILVHIEAGWSLLGQRITTGSVKMVLKEVLDLEEEPLTVENIIKFICGKFEVKVSDVMSNRRDKEISKTRQIAMYASRELTDLSFPAIGKHFGGKNHATVIQACKKTKEWMLKDSEINQTITSIIKELSKG